MENTSVAENYTAQEMPQENEGNLLQQEMPQEQDWKSAFSPEYKQALDRYKCADDLIKTTLSAQALLGKRNNQWKAEDAESYRAVMGTNYDIPANANEYDIELLSQNSLDEPSVNIVKQASQLMGLNQNQAQQLYEFCDDMYKTDIEAQNQEKEIAMQKCGEVLSSLWGKDYPNQLKAVELCAEQVFPKITGMSVEEINDLLDSTNSRENPLLLAAMSFIGKSMMESSSPGYYGSSPMDAKIEVEAMQNDKEIMNKMLNIWDPKTAALRKEFFNRIERKNQMM